MPDVQPIKNLLKQIEEEAKNPLPTPEVGTMVIWYPAAEVKKNAEIAAVVTKVEGPGRVFLTTWRPNGMPEHKQGVHHVSHEIHKRRAHANSRSSGAWDYPIGVRAPKHHTERHLAELEKKRESFQEQIAKAEAMNKASQENKPQRQPA